MTLLDKKIPLAKIGSRLRARRMKLGLSQGMIAYRAGLKDPYVSNVELGKTATNIEAIRRAILDGELLNRRWRKANREIAKRRSLFDALPNSPEKAALEFGMLERATYFLECGKAEEADAILELLPAEKADALLNEFFGDDNGT